MNGHRRAGGILVVSLATFVMLGMVDGSLGVAWPNMQTRFDRGIADLGLLLAALSLGYLTASTGFGRVHARAGTGPALIIGSGLIGAGMVGVATTPVWPLLVVAAVFLGLGGGLVDSGMNAHAALAFDVRSTNLLHAAYGLGATMGPLVITASLTLAASWRGGYGFLAILQVVSLGLVWRWRHRWVSPLTESHTAPLPPARLLAILAVFLLYTGAEVAVGQWAFTTLTVDRGMAIATAGAWVATYWAGLTAGRFLVGMLGDRVLRITLVNLSLAVALAGVGFLWWDPMGVGAIGLPMAGLGFAAIFPTLVSLTPARIGRLHSTRVMGYQLAAANIGAGVVPWAIGLIAGAAGVGSLPPSLFAATGLLVVMHLLSDRAWPDPLC